MQTNISGPGVGLPPPAGLYPVPLLNGAPYNENTNMFTLAAGQALPIPAGTYMVSHGPYSVVQWLDPVTGLWRGFNSARAGAQIITSDGFTRRIANLTGCPIAAVVTNVGSSYVQATTSVSVDTGNSTWYPIVGGAIATNPSVTSPGSGYGMAPIIFIPAPPNPGVQATAYATISSGTVSSITVTNQGAGYLTAPVPVILPNPADPNLSSITNATATTSISAQAGKVCAVICTNPGVAIAAQPTLTITGAGTSAAATAVWMNTITATSVSAVGAGYGAASELTTIGGLTAATPALTNPAIELTGYIPRPAMAALSVSGGTITSVTSLNDSGLFTGTPTALVLTNGIVTTIGTVVLTRGGTTDLCSMQPL